MEVVTLQHEALYPVNSNSFVKFAPLRMWISAEGYVILTCCDLFRSGTPGG
jgi:hypothetical protein